MDDGGGFVPFVINKRDDLGIKEGGGSGLALLTSSPAPWLQFETVDKSIPPLVRLHNEILTFCEYISPTRAELATRDQVLTEITDIIIGLWPSATVHVFGSHLTKMITPTSDLDLAMLNVPCRDPAQPLQTLAEFIRSKGIVSYIEVIHAKVPIIKLDHLRSGISVDICCNNSSGLDTGKLVTEMSRVYPPLRPLTMLLKTFLVAIHFLFFMRGE